MKRAKEDAGHYAPMFKTSDPRHGFHTGKALRAEATLAELESTVHPLVDVLRVARAETDSIRSASRGD
jgi:hypothetical protein